MKIRQGFVSNSSSSSFVCNICDETISGWDIDLSECEMSQCECGHVFCNDHFNADVLKNITKDIYISTLNSEYNSEIINQIKNMTEDEFNKYKEENEGAFDDLLVYEIPVQLCPICNPKLLDKKNLKTFRDNVENKLNYYNNFLSEIRKIKDEN